MIPQAIETHYNGFAFRSRLEARWAVFFDCLRIPYEYEREGFTLPDGPYLPDFFLPSVRGGMWCEVKPTDCENAERATLLMRQLARLTHKDGVVVHGDPRSFQDDNRGAWLQFKDEGEDGPFYFCLCPWCGKIGFEFDGRGARVCGYKTHHESEELALAAIKHLGHWRADDKCYTKDHDRIIFPAIAARSARFEHA